MFSTIFKAFNEVSFSPLAQGLASIFGSDVFKFDKNQKRGPDGKWATQGVGAAGKLSIKRNQRNYKVDDVVLAALDGDAATLKQYNDAIAQVSADVKAGKCTDVLNSRNGDGTGGYTKDRLKLHHQILEHFFKKEADYKPDTPPPSFIVLGGRGGSGKSNFDSRNDPKDGPKFGVYDGSKALLIDPDAIKEMLPGYDPQKAYLFHEESGAIADKLHKMARDKGLNVVMDITLKSFHGSIVEKFKKAGYHTEAHFMHKQPEFALRGAVRRWNHKVLIKNPLTGEAKEFPKGRLVPPSVIESNTNNEHNFDRMARMTDNWSVVSNTSPNGFTGERVASKPKPVKKLDSFATVLKANPYHDELGRFTSKDRDSEHYSATREFTKEEIALLKGVKISSGSKLAEAMDNATDGHVDVQAIKATLAKGGKNYAQVEIPLSHIDWSSVTDEVAAVRADPNKGAILVGAHGEIVDGRHRSLLAKQLGDKAIKAWVPVADALKILSKVKKAERILRPYELEPKSLESVQKSNPNHEPAGSPKGGQFASKEKAALASSQYASMLKDIGGSSPHAPWLKALALATNIKAKSHGALDLELAHDWLAMGHSQALLKEVGVDLSDDELKAMTYWKSKEKAAATKFKALFDKDYTKHYAEVQDAIDKFGPDSAQVKKLNKVGVSWVAQAYKFGASPAQVKEALAGVEKSYNDAKLAKSVLAKTNIMASLKQMAKDSELHGTPFDHDLEKSALAMGVDTGEVTKLIQDGKHAAVEEKKVLKTTALESAKSAAYNVAKALDEHGKDSPEYAAAVASQVAAVTAGLKHANSTDLGFFTDTGKAHYATYKKDMGALKVKYGESLSKTMAEYATANFKDRKNSTELADHAAKVHSKLSAEQVAAIGSYTSSGFRQLNKEVGAAGTAVMKGQKPTFISDHRVKQMERMDDAFKDTTLGYDTKLYRNMAQKYFWEQLGISGNSMDAITDAQMNSVVGRVYKETAFSSTTTDVNLGLSLQDTALQSGRLTLNIRAGKKMPGMLVTAISSHSHENEVILPRGTTYVIKGIRRGVKGEKFIVDVDMIGAFPDKIN